MGASIDFLTVIGAISIPYFLIFTMVFGIHFYQTNYIYRYIKLQRYKEKIIEKEIKLQEEEQRIKDEVEKRLETKE